MFIRPVRRIVGCLFSITVLLLASACVFGQVAKSATLDNFRAGYIIADSKFFTHDTLTVEQIQAFLDQYGADCVSKGNNICLKDYQEATANVDANSNCLAYEGSGTVKESAAQIISKVAKACNISEKVFLVIIQKEQGMITTSDPAYVDPDGIRSNDSYRYRTIMGYGCPDGAACDADYFGFWNQLYQAGWQFNQYTKGNFNYKPFSDNTILYNPDRLCGSSTVYIENWATAALYIYTPYQPDSAALQAGYGAAGYCSSYGNRNFFLYYNDWFGNSQSEFTDIQNLAADRRADIEWLSDYRITMGCDAKGTKFCPTNPVNRGSMAEFLLRLSGETVTLSETSSFPDVSLQTVNITYSGNNKTTAVQPVSQTRLTAINWLADKGITHGSDSTTNGQVTFRPWDPVNRGSMAEFLMRYAGVQAPDYSNIDFSLTSATDLLQSMFPDCSPVDVQITYQGAKSATLVSALSYERIYAINWLAQQSITQGSQTTNTNVITYRPFDTVNRGSMAQFLHRLRLAGF
jgi:hypothetical protein